MENTNKEFLEILKFVAPGTEIRKGIDNILDAGTGGLLLLGSNEDVIKLCDGGFYIDTEYNPQRIYELAKMDGAIILSDDLKKIIYVNVQLQPNSEISTKESGTRHKTAERVAKQTGKLVVAISQRRKRVSVYKDDFRYILRNIPEIMTEATLAIKTLERFGDVIDKALTNLTIMEFEDLVTLFEVASILQRFALMSKVTEEIGKYVVELGEEGRLIKTQFDVIMSDLNEEIESLIKDYYNVYKEDLNCEGILKRLKSLSRDEQIEIEEIAFILGYKKRYEILDQRVVPRGYRLLGKVKRLTAMDIESLITGFDGLTAILDASEDEISEMETISKIKARSIKNEIKRLKITAQLEKV